MQRIRWASTLILKLDAALAEEQVKQVDGGVLRRLCGNGPKRWLVGRGDRFPLPGGPLDDGKFALIEPEEMTCGAGVDHGVARSVVGVHFHLPLAKWAIEPPLILVAIDRNR